MLDNSRTRQKSDGAGEEYVLVGRGEHASKYHKLTDNGTPPCQTRGSDDPSNWRVLQKDSATDRRDPCQYDACFGDINHSHTGRSLADKIVEGDL